MNGDLHVRTISTNVEMVGYNTQITITTFEDFNMYSMPYGYAVSNPTFVSHPKKFHHAEKIQLCIELGGDLYEWIEGDLRIR